MLDLDEERLLAALTHARVVRIVVDAAKGSVPRDAGTWMGVIERNETLLGTIGGGRLEHDAVAHARALLAGTASELRRRMPLGPSLGQCCGGVVELRFERHDAASAAALRASFEHARADVPAVALFGGGHVGRAIVRAIAPLPLRLEWIDSRDEIFPEPAALGLAAWPLGLVMEHSDPVQRAVADLEPGTLVLVMSYSHAEDLDIVASCLTRCRSANDLPFIGLIGSATKWATFRHRLEARGFAPHELARITCPIGVPGIAGKEPEVIAAAVAAQLLRRRPRADIRRARPDEAAAINSLVMRAKAHWGYAREQLDAWRAELEVRADDLARRPCFVAVDRSDALAGFVALVPGTPRWELDNLWVEPASMRHGIGRQLLWHALDTARRDGAAAVAVDSDPHAAAFYQAAGARPAGHVAAALPHQPERVRPRFVFDLSGSGT
jgi:xanthine dehydrogenase accessory factor